MESPTPDRPTGRDAVRRAILSTARSVFAAQGPRASIRVVAEAAGVNPGLIHRHVGNKDDLLAAVLERGLEHGHTRIRSTSDAGQAVREMLSGASANPDFSRLLVWLSLDPGSVGRPLLEASSRPAEAVTRMSDPAPLSDLHVAVALTVIYAWPVLRDQVLDVLEIAPEDRVDADARIGDLLAEFVTGSAADAGPGRDADLDSDPGPDPDPGDASRRRGGGRA